MLESGLFQRTAQVLLSKVPNPLLAQSTCQGQLTHSDTSPLMTASAFTTVQTVISPPWD